MSLLIHQTNRKPFALQGPTSSHTPHLHPLMRRTSQGKELQKRNAQRSKTRLLPFHPIPKMTVLLPPNEDDAFILSPPPKDECPENNISFPNGDELHQYEALAFLSHPRDECPQKDTFTILPPRDELLDEDEPSFLNSSIPILPPPMPSLQLLHHAQLPFPATAPLACSTPHITTPSPPPKDYES